MLDLFKLKITRAVFFINANIYSVDFNKSVQFLERRQAHSADYSTLKIENLHKFDMMYAFKLSSLS